MNLKSYSRGIGAGLIVAALVLGVGTKAEKMSDDDVKKRAVELGMIESVALVDINNDTASKTSVSVEDIKKEEALPEADVTANEGTDVKDSESTPEFKEPDEVTVPPIVSVEEEITPPPIDPLPEDETGFTEEEDGVEIVVIHGDSSVSVSRRMYEAGLVESAVEFDRFLCENGYDKVVSVGHYKIPFGLSFDEMAQIITGRK